MALNESNGNGIRWAGRRPSAAPGAEASPSGLATQTRAELQALLDGLRAAARGDFDLRLPHHAASMGSSFFIWPRRTTPALEQQALELDERARPLGAHNVKVEIENEEMEQARRSLEDAAEQLQWTREGAETDPRALPARAGEEGDA